MLGFFSSNTWIRKRSTFGEIFHKNSSKLYENWRIYNFISQVVQRKNHSMWWKNFSRELWFFFLHRIRIRYVRFVVYVYRRWCRLRGTTYICDSPHTFLRYVVSGQCRSRLVFFNVLEYFRVFAISWAISFFIFLHSIVVRDRIRIVFLQHDRCCLWSSVCGIGWYGIWFRTRA